MKMGLLGNPEEGTFRKAKVSGLDFVEFSIHINSNINQFLNDVNLIKKWSEEYKVGVQSIGRWGSDRIDSNGKIIEEELKRTYQLIDVASILNCENFVCGCNYINELSYQENCNLAIEYLSKLIKYGKEKGVKISTYNCDWNNFIDNESAWSSIHENLPELGIKFDPSHSRYAGRDYLKEMRDWGDRFYHVHIKGSLIINGERFDDPPAGLDQTDWKSFMAVLYAKGYDAGLSIEPHSDNWTGELGEKGINYTIEFMKQLLL